MSDLEALAEALWRAEGADKFALADDYTELAEAVLASDWLAERVQAARAGALEEAADELDAVGHYWSGAPAHEFFALANDLRARAAVLRSQDAGDGGEA